jgi:hypothetical protein
MVAVGEYFDNVRNHRTVTVATNGESGAEKGQKPTSLFIPAPMRKQAQIASASAPAPIDAIQTKML